MPGDSDRLGTLISLISVESSSRNNRVLLNLSSGDCSVCVLNNVKNMKMFYSVSSQCQFPHLTGRGPGRDYKEVLNFIKFCEPNIKDTIFRLSQKYLREIWSFHSGVFVLGFGSFMLGWCFPTFRELRMTLKPQRSFETSANTNLATQRHIPDNSNPLSHSAVNSKFPSLVTRRLEL